MALLGSYSSGCVAHGVYLLALAVAVLGFAEFASSILEFRNGRCFLHPVRRVCDGCYVGFGGEWFHRFVYVLGGTIVWGCLRSVILGVRPKGGSVVAYDPEETTATLLLQLHEGSVDYVKKKHGFWAQFYGLRLRHLALIWLDLFIVLLIVSLLLLRL